MSNRVLLVLVAIDAFLALLVFLLVDEIIDLARDDGRAYVAAAIAGVLGAVLMVVLFTLSGPARRDTSSRWFLPLMILVLGSVPLWSLLSPVAGATLFGFLAGFLAAGIFMMTVLAIANHA